MFLKVRKIYFICLILLIIQINELYCKGKNAYYNQEIVKRQKLVEIEEEFSIVIEHTFEKSNTNWTNRAVIEFGKKSSNKNDKSAVSIKENKLTEEVKILLVNECKLAGGYYLRFKLNGKYFYSNIDPVYYLSYLHIV